MDDNRNGYDDFKGRNSQNRSGGHDDDLSGYSFDNFDDEVNFPSRGDSGARRGKIKNYDEYANFDDDKQFADEIKYNMSYDEDAVQTRRDYFEPDYEEDAQVPLVQTPAQSDDELPPSPPDYGDNFDSQTGEQSNDYMYDLKSDERGEYYTKSSRSSGRMKQIKRRKNKHRSRNAAVALTIAAVLCLVAAIVFAFVQCSSSNPSSSTAASSSTATVTVAQTTQDATTYEGDDTKAEYTYAVQTQAPATQAPQTEAAQTEAPTAAPETQAVQTQAPTEAPTEAPQSSEQQSENSQEETEPQATEAPEEVSEENE